MSNQLHWVGKPSTTLPGTLTYVAKDVFGNHYQFIETPLERGSGWFGGVFSPDCSQQLYEVDYSTFRCHSGEIQSAFQKWADALTPEGVAA